MPLATARRCFSGLPRPLAAMVIAAVISACAPLPSPVPVAVPPLAPGQARLWFYRDFLPGDTMTAPAVAINAWTVGYAYPGAHFYRDLPAGRYLVTVDTQGRDVGQSQQLALVPGEQEYIKIMSLPSWATDFRGRTLPTYYARAVAPRIAAAELPLTSYFGGQ